MNCGLRIADRGSRGEGFGARGSERGSAKGGLLTFIAVVVLLGLVFHRPLMSWFGVGGGARASKPHAHGGAAMSGELRASLTDALRALDEIGVALTKDEVELGHAAHELEAALESAAKSGGETAAVLESAAAEARRLGQARGVDDARKALQDVSAKLLPVVAGDAELTSSWYLFECPMVDGFNKWVQSHPSLENPYMGQRMLKCGSAVEWSTIAAVESPDEIAHYTCPMHPSVQSDRPGQCPICAMDLTPVTKGEIASGVIHIDSVRQQRIGVRVGEVERRNLTTVVRATGRTAYDESRIREVTLRLGGFVERLHVNETGRAVRRGQPMLELYSPELLAAQKEYLIALRSSQRASSTGAPDRADYLVRAAREKLRLWGIAEPELDRIAATGEPLQRVPLLAPYSGYVIEKNVVEGASVMAGQSVFRIAGLDRIWVEAEVYEQDLQHVDVGSLATITLPSVRSRSWEGQVAYVHPYLDPATRTGKIRIELENHDLTLKPEMFADVVISIDRGDVLVVPDDAIVQTGPRQLVFLDLGEGRFRPKEVKAGPRNGDWVEIVDGLKEGDRIVVSSNFLVAAESRIRSSERFWGGGAEESGGGHERH
jgi:membrane fusion protein, copper/silver efflux system